jgi:predicted nucleic acid-binding Zn ribbon protein
MATRKITRIGDILPSVLKRLGLEQKFKEQAVLALWSDVVGPELASRTAATRIDKGVLYVRVDHGAWMQELHFIQKDLVRRLREAAPGVDLKRIRFSAKEVS